VASATLTIVFFGMVSSVDPPAASMPRVSCVFDTCVSTPELNQLMGI